MILNRVESGKFPNNVCAVVRQPKQFSWYGKKPLTTKQLRFAEDFLSGKYKRTVPKSYFFTSKHVRLKRRQTHVIGGHRFYGF